MYGTSCGVCKHQKMCKYEEDYGEFAKEIISTEDKEEYKNRFQALSKCNMFEDNHDSDLKRELDNLQRISETQEQLIRSLQRENAELARNAGKRGEE